MPRLLTNATADGPGEAVRVRPDASYAQFGTPTGGTIGAHGTFDGATVTILAQLTEGGHWYALKVIAAEAVDNVGLHCHALRADLSGAGAATDVTVEYVSPYIAEVL